MQTWSNLVFIFGFEISRVSPDCEIGPATDAIDLVDRTVSAPFEACCRGDGQVASGRKANHANSLWVDGQFFGFASDQADGALCILEWPSRRFPFWFVRSARHP